MSCPEPFELKMDDTCCGYCWAPDHAIPLDRHAGIKYNSTGMVVDQCESAPSFCKAPAAEIPVRCFQPSCRVGESPHCGSGACCAMCKPDGSSAPPAQPAGAAAPGVVQPAAAAPVF